MKEITLNNKKMVDDFILVDFLFKKGSQKEICEVVHPGQFLMLKNRTEPVLAKPFSVLNSTESGFSMLIKVVGRFTSYLKDAQLKELFYFRGPYGVPYSKKLNMSGKYITIGGGCGVAPIMHFNNTYSSRVEKTILGFKDESVAELINTDDAIFESVSGKTVIDSLEDYLKERKTAETPSVIACGSIGMCKALHEHSRKMGYTLFVSLDERMGCGIGMCKGCPIKTKNGILMVCKDGPLFESEEIIWDW